MDKEKVIKGLETCSIKTGALRCLECPYTKEERNTDKWCTRGLHRDVLALLKEQEPVCVYETKINDETKINKCTCGNIVNRYYHPKFCGYCGKKLIWY